MVTRDLIKGEIDKVEDEYLPALYRTVKALEPRPAPTLDRGGLHWRNG